MRSILVIIAIALSISLGAALISPPKVLFAQTQETKELRNQLEQELAQVEEQIAGLEQELAATKTERNTLQNRINQLKKQQSSLQLQIKATSLKLNSLEQQIGGVQVDIEDQAERLDRLKSQVAKLILLIEQQDDFPLWLRIMLSPSLSDVFGQVRNSTQLLANLQNLQVEVVRTKQGLETQKQTLAEKQDEQQKLLSISVLQQQKLTESVREQNTLLSETKGRESAYQAGLSDAKKRAQAIRTRIYQLLDVNTQITFGQAVQIADWVSQQTGIRTAFLLAVLTQESNLGKNVGTCNRRGDPPEKSWRVVMKPERDQEPFLTITTELGMDPDVTPVSCPMRDKNGKQIGWGGAMGPAQFIPSTWMGYRAKVTALTGKPVANPWDIRDAFVAAAVLLKANGANGTRDGEWAAAMRYFSGSTNTRFRFYGDNVLKLADGYEDDIAELRQ